MCNSNKLMYTATYKAVPIHADLQLARKPRVAAHTAKPRHTDLQLAMKPRVAAHTAKSSIYIRTNNLQGTLKRDIRTSNLQ